MKTANPNMHIFKDEKGARKHFVKQAKAQLLKSIDGDFFVETIVDPEEETAIQCWPNSYTLIDEK